MKLLYILLSFLFYPFMYCMENVKFFQAMQNKDLAIVQLIIKQNPKFLKHFPGINQILTHETLGHALESDADEIAQWLIEQGAPLNGIANDGKYPLQIAAEKGKASLAKLMIQKGAEVDKSLYGIGTPLQLFFRTCSHKDDYRENKTPEFLIAAGASILVPHFEQFPLIRYVEIIDETYGKYLVLLAIQYAFKNRDIKRMQQLIKYDCSSSIKELIQNKLESGNTIVHIFAKDDSYRELIRLLLKNGANPNIQNIEGRTPLHEAIRYGDKVMVTLLLGYGADITIPDNDGMTPFQYALKNPRILITMLCNWGHPEEMTDFYRFKYYLINNLNYNSHMFSIFYSVTKSLGTSCQSKVQQSDADGDTLLHCVAAEDKTPWRNAKIKWLIKQGASVNAKNKKGLTPLHIAISHQDKSLISLLLGNDANILIEDKNGYNAIHYALQQVTDRPEILLLMIPYNGIDYRQLYKWRKENQRISEKVFDATMDYITSLFMKLFIELKIH